MLAEKGRREKVDLVVLAGDVYGYGKGKGGILKPFAEMKQKVLFVPGNCDFDEEVVEMSKVGKNLVGYYVTYNGVGIAGIGSKNWKLAHDAEDLAKVSEVFAKMKSDKKILVSHLHAEGTLAEFSGVPGESVLRKVVKEFNPDFLISAHIHEAEGVRDRVGKTEVVQVGKEGEILEI